MQKCSHGRHIDSLLGTTFAFDVNHPLQVSFSVMFVIETVLLHKTVQYVVCASSLLPILK